MTTDFYPGMGRAVAERTILRKKPTGDWETWSEVAHRVAVGNSLLCPSVTEAHAEQKVLEYHLGKANILLSGRHLQHGDETQPQRNQEVFTNCATSCNSFMLFYLLMNGSGVGRCYDDDLMLVDWDHAPNLRCVLSHEHPEFDYSAHESVRDAEHKYGTDNPRVRWHKVGDSREGWTKAVEIYEAMAYEKIHKDSTLVLDFSGVRPKGEPIKGMQNRPASGPVSLMNALLKAATVKGSGMARWKQAMYIDHCLAECVLVGGARRSARMSVKSWRDRSVLDFIMVKRPIEFLSKSMAEIAAYKRDVGKPQAFLWSSNNSIGVDQEFWSYVQTPLAELANNPLGQHAHAVFNASCEAGYADGTGEPGLVNIDQLHQSAENLNRVKKFIHSQRYQVDRDSHLYLNRLLYAARHKKHWMVVNPCVTADTWIHTTAGPRRVGQLIGKPFTALVDGKPYRATGFWSTGRKGVFKLSTDRGYTLRLTAEHKVLVETDRRQRRHGGYTVETEWREAQDLRSGDLIVLNNQRGIDWPHTSTGANGTFSTGWLLGQIVGDGGHNPEKYDSYLRFWGPHQETLAAYAVECLRVAEVHTRSDFKGKTSNPENGTLTTTCVGLTELASRFLEPETKNFLPTVEQMGSDMTRGFLRGFFDADGTVLIDEEKGRSVRLAQSDLPRLQVVQRMLARLGIMSTIYHERRQEGYRLLPDGRDGSKAYLCQAQHELTITKDNIHEFAARIGFTDPDKAKQLRYAVDSIERGPYQERFTAKVTGLVIDGEEEVFDCTVDEVHCFDANGIKAHNCGEICLAVWGAFCVIGDVVPYHADSLEEAEEAFRATTRALLRVNTMDSVYGEEVRRTNRIGVGITGIHEFAWKFFKLGFRDLLDEVKAAPFWQALSRFKRAVQEEAEIYARWLGVATPLTDTTIKPAGTTSKLFGLTEGWHLPPMEAYLRWVQFLTTDPLVDQYRAAGYPVLELKTYKNTVIVGFPTTPLLSTLGLGDKLVTAPEATPEEQFRWLQLGEKYWLRGVTEDGDPLPRDSGNQISYTLKYDPAVVDFASFKHTVLTYQPTVKCCSVMPTDDTSSYEYLPEQPITKAEYEALAAAIAAKRVGFALPEDVDKVHVDCAGGACPVDFTKSLTS